MMLGTELLLILLPALVICAGDGNIRLLEDEIAVALRACTYPNGNTNHEEVSKERQRRSENFNDVSPKIDDNTKQINRYSQKKRSSDGRDQIHVLNATDFDNYKGYGSGNMGEKLSSVVPKSATTGSSDGNRSSVNRNKTKRSDPLLNKADTDQCLSQCVFANLQVVDPRGIPHEAELWNKVQSSVTSQQSRSALRDQIRACFQELQSEAEDNGCSYSNKLEHCLMLRLSDRKADKQGSTQKPT